MNLNVVSIVSELKYWITPSHEQSVSVPNAKPEACRASGNVVVSKSVGTNVRFEGMAMPAAASFSRFQRWSQDGQPHRCEAGLPTDPACKRTYRVQLRGSHIAARLA